MTFDRTFGFTCDASDCGNDVFEMSLDGDHADFADSKDEIDRQGWLTRNIGGQWFHFCCQECYSAWKNKQK